jgi:hypothetical protein
MSQQEPATERQFEGSVTAAFPIALLEAMRAHDRPGEILEDEDLTVSLPRRLGLTGVVETQIQRYEAAQRGGRAVRLDELVGLLRLVLRRPDAEPILRETGQRIARWQFRNTPELWQRLLHRGPARLALRSSRRAALRALRALQAGTGIEAARPFTVRVHDAMTARLSDEADACITITGMLEELLLLYTGDARRVTHSHCLARGDTHCEWTHTSIVTSSGVGG